MATETDNAPSGAGVSVPPRENLIRAMAPSPTLERSETDGGMPTMVVDWVRFNEWTEINSVYEGRFMERIAPNAADKTIAESRASMRVLFQHGKDPQIGDKVLGPIADLVADSDGARAMVPLFDTAYNRELLPGLEAGVYGSSFRFQVLQEEFNSKAKRSEHNPNGLPERTVTEMRVREFGPVTFPAYAGATAGLRSMTDEFLFGQFVDDPDRLREILEVLAERRVAEPDPSEEATPPVSKEPEPSAATTRRSHQPVALYPSTREETPKWRL
jgi:phage head maturation protease